MQSDAERYKFIIVAPDSWSAGPSGWQVPLASSYPTYDMLHIQVCIATAFCVWQRLITDGLPTPLQS